MHGLVCHQNGIRGYGNPESGVMIIGIAPGREEVLQGRPFVGPSGRMLDAILGGIGWSREQVYCTNLICWHEDNPTAEQVQECMPRLLAEIKQYQPKVIIMLGHIVTATLTGRATLNRGAVEWSNVYNAYMMATYHPAAILHGESRLFNDVVRDLAKIPLILTWPQDDSYNHVAYYVAQTVAEAQQALDDCAGHYVSVDVETNSFAEEKLDVLNDEILCFAICNEGKTTVIPKACAQGLRWPEANWIFHNGLFDTQSIYQNFAIRLPIVEDTMLMSYSLDERQGYHGLKSLSGEYCAADTYADEVRAYHKRKTEAPLDILYEYNAKDATYTYRLYGILKQMQLADNVRGFYQQLLIPAANAFSEIQLRGVYISEAKMRELALDWLPRQLQMEDDLMAEAQEYGFPGKINLNSPKQLSRLLFEILHLPGGPSTAASVLEGLHHPFVKHLLEFRTLDHMVGTYILGINDDIKRDHRVHADVRLHGTVTGRLSYHEPPLQVIPKEYSLGDDFGRLRSIFAATNDKYTIVETDYSRAEIWCAYFVSRDPQLLADLQSKDFHASSASAIFKKPLEEVSELERYKSKFVTFGIMYGRGASSLADGELNCTVQQAQEYIDNWFARYPQYKMWWMQTRQTVINDGELVSYTGRKRRFGYFTQSEMHTVLNQAVNFPLQSLASDITLSGLIELHQRLKAYDAHICFTVHDSIIMEVNKRDLEPVLALIKEVMTAVRFPGLMSLPIDLKVGPSWGESKKVK